MDNWPWMLFFTVSAFLLGYLYGFTSGSDIALALGAL